MNYDIMIVGAGITAATLVARLRRDHGILVVDTRDHIGGNCYDYRAVGTYIHRYGPHIFHTNNNEVVDFLSNFTEWIPYDHSVLAEIILGGKSHIVPFPYSDLTVASLGRELSNQEIIDTFFKGYSQLMWGKPWDDLPASIRNRVPKKADASNYFPGQFCAMPDRGWTKMMENMFDGADVLLGADPDHWRQIAPYVKLVIYCGRPDHILRDYSLPYRSLDIRFHPVSEWRHGAPVLNFSHGRYSMTRATHYASLTGGKSNIISVEHPYKADPKELAPFYPDISERGASEYLKDLKSQLLHTYPNLVLAGRLGTHKYLDTHQAVGAALNMLKTLRV